MINNNALWHATSDTPTPCPPLTQSLDVDIAIVGGGYTGLWTALWLSTLNPTLDIVVLEARQCGHGASGRNGGWVMASLEGIDAFANGVTGRLPSDVINTLRELLPAFEESLEQHNIHCDFHRGGALYSAARVAQQYDRAIGTLKSYQRLGFEACDYRWLTANEATAMVAAKHTQGAIYTPHVAVVHPRKLVLGLRAAALKCGIRLYEYSPVTAAAQGQLHVSPSSVNGDEANPSKKEADGSTVLVKANAVVWATEGYTDSHTPLSSRLLPVDSGMVATEPLPDDLWQHLGFEQRQAFCDFSRLSTYLQRTADNRLVVGARGRMGYPTSPRHSLKTDPRDTKARIDLARKLFPSLGDTEFPYAWGGSLAIARRQMPHVVFDEHQQWITAGGYTGEGVGASFLMARTLAELLLNRTSILTTMPWVHRGNIQQQLSKWETQPLPYLAFQGMTQCYRLEEHFDAHNAQHQAARLARWTASAMTRFVSYLRQ